MSRASAWRRSSSSSKMSTRIEVQRCPRHLVHDARGLKSQNEPLEGALPGRLPSWGTKGASMEKRNQEKPGQAQGKPGEQQQQRPGQQQQPEFGGQIGRASCRER